MNWRDSIVEMFTEANRRGEFAVAPRFEAPATTEDIEILGTTLKTEVPSALAELLLEANGVMGMLDTKRTGAFTTNTWLVWPSRKMIEENQDLRSGKTYESSVPHSKYLWFTGLGVDGILLGYNIAGERSRLCAWAPIGDELIDLGESLPEVLKKSILHELEV
jgi:hypothetical protein